MINRRPSKEVRVPFGSIYGRFGVDIGLLSRGLGFINGRFRADPYGCFINCGSIYRVLGAPSRGVGVHKRQVFS